MKRFGEFSGEPVTVWLDMPEGKQDNMRLYQDFSYIEPSGRVWLAPKGNSINGASIPRILWPSVGSPYTGNYRNASIVHDVACDPASGIDRADADRMYYLACRAGGCDWKQAAVQYIGVRIGAWANKIVSSRKGLAAIDIDREVISKFEALESGLNAFSSEPTFDDLDEFVSAEV